VSNLIFLRPGLSEEDICIGNTEETVSPEEKSYHFPSECFFLTHKALYIGYSVLHKLSHLENQSENGSRTSKKGALLIVFNLIIFSPIRILDYHVPARTFELNLN